MQIWPLMQEAADHSRPHRMLQVGIVEDDERRVPAKLQGHPLELGGLHCERFRASLPFETRSP
jgi:hypothetical protein